MRWLRKGLRRRPSAATVVATVAVLIALAAPGYGALQSVFAARAGNADKVDGLRASKKPRPNTLLALNSHGKFPASVGVAGRQGPEGVQGRQGIQGSVGPQGNAGSVGAPGSALAYSTILYEPPDGGGPPVWRIDDTLSKKLDNDVNLGTYVPGSGVFCFHDLPFTVTNAVATPGPFGPKGAFLVQVATAPPGQPAISGCPPNTGAAVYVTDTNGNLKDPPDTTDTIYFELN